MAGGSQRTLSWWNCFAFGDSAPTPPFLGHSLHLGAVKYLGRSLRIQFAASSSESLQTPLFTNSSAASAERRGQARTAAHTRLSSLYCFPPRTRQTSQATVPSRSLRRTWEHQRGNNLGPMVAHPATMQRQVVGLKKSTTFLSLSVLFTTGLGGELSDV